MRFSRSGLLVLPFFLFIWVRYFALEGNRPLEPRELEVEFFPMEEVLYEEIEI
jgi:hypothetical protein